MDRTPLPVRRMRSAGRARPALYTEEERLRRDATRWTLVQGVLAPVQFAVFLVSLVLVLRWLATGEGFAVATASVVLKTLLLYTIMVTGSIWEKVVFGRWLFVPAFFWEDVFSMLVLALHSGYLVALYTDALSPRGLMLLALAAYAAYVVNATQFLLKLRAARLDEAQRRREAAGSAGGSSDSSARLRAAGPAGPNPLGAAR
ncbi:MAG: 2-vinyl bacteriochlorophyllide hydratase [Rubrivivax sp.]